MDFGSILGNLGNVLGGKKDGAAAGGGLQDILSGLNLGEGNPLDIITKFKNGEISLDQAQDTLKQLAGKLGLEDKLGDLLGMLKK